MRSAHCPDCGNNECSCSTTRPRCALCGVTGAHDCDGGSAFPVSPDRCDDGISVYNTPGSPGMSLRAYIAVEALPIVFRASGIEGPLSTREAASISQAACHLADALIEALKEGGAR